MNRSAIKTGLFDLLSTVQFDLGNGQVTFATASPKLKHWNDVPPSQQPAFFLSQGPQSINEPPVPGAPQKKYLDYFARVYVNTAGEADPTDALNPILDALEAALSSDACIPQTLGGLVQWARIQGTIETFEGTLGDQEVALVPIRILAV